MTGARQIIAVIRTFRKSNKDSLERGASAPNFIFFSCPTSISMLWRICVYIYIYTHTHTHIHTYIHTHMIGCVEIVYELLLLPNK